MVKEQHTAHCKTAEILGFYTRMSVKRGPYTCGWRMRMGKCGWKNADNKKIKKEKTRNADGKKNK